MYDCKVIVKDIFSNDETGKFKALNVSQDKTHSAHSRKSADLDAPDYLEKKAAILWPQMCDEEAWTKLETAVMPKVLQSSLPIAQSLLHAHRYQKVILLSNCISTFADIL